MVLTLGPGEHSLGLNRCIYFWVCWVDVLTFFSLLVLKTKVINGVCTCRRWQVRYCFCMCCFSRILTDLCYQCYGSMFGSQKRASCLSLFWWCGVVLWRLHDPLPFAPSDTEDQFSLTPSTQGQAWFPPFLHAPLVWPFSLITVFSYKLTKIMSPAMGFYYQYILVFKVLCW